MARTRIPSGRYTALVYISLYIYNYLNNIEVSHNLKAGLS
jgi:hypothetical protein